MAPAFFRLDCHTGQPVCFSLTASAQSVAPASPELRRVAAEILGATPGAVTRPLVLADN